MSGRSGPRGGSGREGSSRFESRESRLGLGRRPNRSRSPPCGELSPKATEGSVADSNTARSSVAESETDPLIRSADLSPARRGTAKRVWRHHPLLLS
jgi:hypothetical protein